jgi:threonine dehydrogenase-like Zn-dependent dehydrogenase
MPFGAAMNKGLTIKTGQTHVQRYGKPLLEKIEAGQIDPSFIITHRLPLEKAPHPDGLKVGRKDWSDRHKRFERLCGQSGFGAG